MPSRTASQAYHRYAHLYLFLGLFATLGTLWTLFPPTRPQAPPVAQKNVPAAEHTRPAAIVNERVGAPAAGDLAADPAAIPASLPTDLKSLATAERKRRFFDTILPAVHRAIAEVRQDRRRLESILARQSLPFPNRWQDLSGLSPEEHHFLARLSRRYRADDPAQLLERVDILPLSLILAQAAMESSWGTSRFALEGNNLFGVWTWEEDGMIPHRRDPDKTHRVARYPSLLASVRAYLLNINRHPAYATLRRLRTATLDPLVLADGLELYSARGELYVEELRQIITANRLTDFDRLLADQRLASPTDLTAL